MNNKLCEELRRGKFFINSTDAYKHIKSDDGSYVSISYNNLDEDFPKINIFFRNYYADKNDFIEIIRTIKEEMIKVLGEKETEEVIKNELS